MSWPAGDRRNRFPELSDSISFYGVHAGEELRLTGMPLPDPLLTPGLTSFARGTANLDRSDVEQLRDFCNRWLRAFDALDPPPPRSFTVIEFEAASSQLLTEVNGIPLAQPLAIGKGEIAKFIHAEQLDGSVCLEAMRGFPCRKP